MIWEPAIAMRRRIRLISLFVALLVGTNAYGQSHEDPDAISYIHVDRPFQVYSAIRLGGDFLAFGRRTHMRFTDKFSPAEYGGGHRFNGYVRHVRAISNQRIVAAGHNMDTWQSSIFLTTPGKYHVPIEKTRRLKDRSTYELHVNSEGQPVLLSGTSRRNYTLTIFTKNLSGVVNSVEFGFGQSADFLIKSNGNYAVVGFDSIDGIKGVIPTYWEFSPDLEQATKERLGVTAKRRGLTSAMMELVSFEDSVYAAYGWDVSGVKDEKPGNRSYAIVAKASTTRFLMIPNFSSLELNCLVPVPDAMDDSNPTASQGPLAASCSRSTRPSNWSACRSRTGHSGCRAHGVRTIHVHAGRIGLPVRQGKPMGLRLVWGNLT